MRILHFSHKPVYPKIDGGCIAIADSLERLQKISDNNITHVTLSTHKHQFDIETYLSENKSLQLPLAFEINTKLNPFGAVLALLKGESYNIKRFYNHQVAKQLDNILCTEKHEFAWLESIFTLPYLSVFKKHGVKVILRGHNVEHKIWEELVENCNSPIKKIYLKKLAKQLKEFEISELNKVDGLACISNSDAEYFTRELSGPVIKTITTSQEVAKTDNQISSNSVYHLAAMDWLPNREGLNWFVNKVLPHINSNIKIKVAGKSLRVEEYVHPQIINLGEIEDAESFVAQNGICIIPLQSGSGIRMKVIQNLAFGKAIISTLKGIEGLNVTEKEVIIKDDPISFAQAINTLFIDNSKRELLGIAAKKYISDNFAPRKIEKQIVEFIKEI